MCLFTREIKPRIAKNDIVVLKYLRTDGANFTTPYVGTNVELGKVIKACPLTPHIKKRSVDYSKREVYAIKEGVIHAKLFESTDYGNYCAKAIIPKGTKYWLDTFGIEIAAEQMLITEEKGSNNVLEDKLAQEILEKAPESNGIRIGDYLMKNRNYIHPRKNIAKTKVVGIVCGFYKDKTPIVCAIERFSERWDTICNSKTEERTSFKKAMTLFNGRNVTKKYIEGSYDKNRFPAFERCINYRNGKGEEWFFCALGENMAMLDNAIYLNAAHIITGLGFIITDDCGYWSCSEHSSNDSWGCFLLGNGELCCDWDRKCYSYNIVPFFAKFT